MRHIVLTALAGLAMVVVRAEEAVVLPGLKPFTDVHASKEVEAASSFVEASVPTGSGREIFQQMPLIAQKAAEDNPIEIPQLAPEKKIVESETAGREEKTEQSSSSEQEESSSMEESLSSDEEMARPALEAVVVESPSASEEPTTHQPAPIDAPGSGDAISSQDETSDMPQSMSSGEDLASDQYKEQQGSAVVTGASTTHDASSQILLMPTTFERRLPMPTMGMDLWEDGELEAEGYFTATRATQFLGPNGLASDGAEVVRMPASLRAFKSCIYGCSSVTIPAKTGGETVVVVLPFTVPCSLVSCPPCTTCISSTVSITVCPVVSTVTPTPAKATVFTYNNKNAEPSPSCPAVETATSTLTVTRTRVPIGCPVGSGSDGMVPAVEKALPLTYQLDEGPESVCSSFVVCSPRHFTCPACQLGKTVDLDSVMRQLASDSLASTTTMTVGGHVESAVAEEVQMAHAKLSNAAASSTPALLCSLAVLAAVLVAMQ